MSEDDAIAVEILRRLYTTPPNEFVATRKALAAELRREGDRSGATAVAALRKAAGVDVALNLVSVQEPDAVDAFLGAATAVRDAQTAATSARDALRELRARTAALVAAAGRAAGAAGVTGVTTAAATARLGELVASEAAAEQLRAAHLGSGAVEAADPFGGVASTPAPPPREDRKAAARRERLEATLARATDQRDRAQADLDAADQGVAEAEAAVAEAESRLAGLRADLERAGTARAKAVAGLERAEAALADAQEATGPGA